MSNSSPEDINQNKDQSTTTDEQEARDVIQPEVDNFYKKGSVVFDFESPSELDQEKNAKTSGDNMFKSYAQIGF